jgi:hypothetical protein
MSPLQLAFHITPCVRPYSRDFEWNTPFGKHLRQSRPFATSMFVNARCDIRGKSKIVLCSSLPAVRNGLLEVQQVDSH